MSFGLALNKANGALAYSSSDVTWNQVDCYLVPGGGSDVRFLPQLQGREVLLFQIMINPPPTDRRAVAHTLVNSAGTITVSGGSESSYVLVLMR